MVVGRGGVVVGGVGGARGKEGVFGFIFECGGDDEGNVEAYC
jgi:hypothetical protein